jgi:hypothetical protein
LVLPVAYEFDRQQGWVWSQDPGSAVRRALTRLRWQDLRRVAPGASGAMVVGFQDVSWTYGLQSDEELLLYMADPHQNASVTLSLPGPMAGSLFDPEAGNEVQPVRIETDPWDLTTFTVPPGRTVALVLTRVR